MNVFRRSEHFKGLTKFLIDTFRFKTGDPMYSVFCWLIFPLMIAVYIGWLLGDIIIQVREV